MSDALRVFVLLPSLAVAALHAADVPLDPRAVDDERSHIAHVNEKAASGGTATTAAISNTTVKFTGTSYGSQPTLVSPTRGRNPQAEEHIAASANGTLVAAISDFSAGRTGFAGYNSTMYAVFSPLASQWTASYVPFVTSPDGNVRLQTDDGKQWDFNSDPVVAFDAAGNAYIADLYLDNSPSTANGIYLTKLAYDSSTGAMSYAGTTPVVSTDGSQYDEDKEWLAIDRLSGAMYVSWTRFTGNSDAIWLASSTDGGATWSSAQISPASLNGAVQGSQVVVGTNHVVYVAWHVAYTGNRGRIWLASSADDFASAKAITPLFNELTFNSSYRKNSFPALAASADGSQLHLVYADMPSRSLGAEVEYTVSTNGGATFSAPLTLNSSASGQQFMPAIAVDTLGGVHVSWFDTRNASNASSYDIYAIHGSPSGAGISWGANCRVTPKPVSAGNASFIGDYAGICAGPADPATAKAPAHPVWTNGGFNGGTLQTTTLVPAN